MSHLCPLPSGRESKTKKENEERENCIQMAIAVSSAKSCIISWICSTMHYNFQRTQSQASNRTCNKLSLLRKPAAVGRGYGLMDRREDNKLEIIVGNINQQFVCCPIQIQSFGWVMQSSSIFRLHKMPESQQRRFKKKDVKQFMELQNKSVIILFYQHIDRLLEFWIN